MSKPPILQNKFPASASVFVPKALIREARRQKRLPATNVPRVCILDPDGDIVRRLRKDGRAKRFEAWACYHSELDEFTLGPESVGIVGCAVGAPYAVLIAEQLFACGCQFLVSVTSAGQINAVRAPPYFVIIDRALRDEGCSYHYAAASEFAEAEPRLVTLARDALERCGINILVGPSWTTDAPFRETAEAIDAAQSKGVLAVEMEAAALYSFARSKGVSVLCLAHVTNSMGQVEEDFEKGEADGTAEALLILEIISDALRI